MTGRIVVATVLLAVGATVRVGVGGNFNGATPLAVIWCSYSKVKSFESDIRDLKDHGVGLIAVDARDTEEAGQMLAIARRHQMQLAISVPDVTESGTLLSRKGYSLPDALMIGGVYAGKAIDRHLFKFTAGRHSILIEPPVYNRRFAYTRGSTATGRQVKGEPIGHYFPDMPPPARAEVVVPLKAFDGRQHLKIVPAGIEVAPLDARPERDSVGEDFPPSSEIRGRTLYNITFDLTGLENALLDQVGVAVYWPYRGTNQYWIFGRGTVTAAVPEARAAAGQLVREEIARWTAAAGGTFPADTVRALRFGDECFYITCQINADAPAVSYPLWDYSGPAIEQFRLATNGLEYPRTWGYPEIYGEDAYAWWLYRLHENSARLLRASRETLDQVAPSVRLFRNSTRFGVFHVANDHDGSGPELLTAASDIVHLDPYPVNAAGYQPVIPRDMSYYAGLARRYHKTLIPWLQAHTYGGPEGLQDVTPSQVARMVEEQRKQGVDGIMWLGYGKTFPLVRPESWQEAGRLHEGFRENPPAKPHARLAVLRPYRKWALSALAKGAVRNPADWMLQQFLEVWSVEGGNAYDVFELPPSMSDEARKTLDASVKQYEFVVGTEAYKDAWVLGEGTNSQEIDPRRAPEFRQLYRRELLRRGWMDARTAVLSPKTARVALNQADRRRLP